MGSLLSSFIKRAVTLLSELGNPGGAAGDIIYWDGTNWVRLAKGTDGQLLQSGTTPSWTDAPASEFEHSMTRLHIDFPMVLDEDGAGIKSSNIWTYASSGADTNVGGGVIRLFTGSTTGNGARIYMDNLANIGLFTRNKAFELHFIVKLAGITSQNLEVGLTDNTADASGTTGDDYALFRFDTAVDGNWYVKTNDNGTAPAAVDTGIAASTDITILSIINDETDIKFYINGTLEHTATTDLPTAATAIFPKFYIETLVDSAKALHCLACYGLTDRV